MENHLEYENGEISIKELILVLVKHWKIVTGFIFVFGISAWIYLFFIAKPVYESSIDGIISIPELVDTRYGEYPFPTQNPQDFLNVIKSDRVIKRMIHTNMLKSNVVSLRNQIDIKQDKDASRFMITMKAGTPEEAKSLLEGLSKLYLEEINYIYKQNALRFFERMHYTNLNKIGSSRDVLTKTIKEYEVILNKMDRVIPLKKLILSDPVYAAEIAKSKSIDLSNLSEQMMLEEYVNPNYEEFELQIIELKKSYALLDIDESKYQSYLNEIVSESAQVSKFFLGNKDISMNEGLLEVLRPYVIISEEAVLPEGPVAPRKMMGLAIALVLGTMLGIFVALFIGYWKNEAK